MVQRNQTRDYLDVVALADRYGHTRAVETLTGIDSYYADRCEGPDSVLTAVVQRLSEPAPQDARVTTQLASYKNLDPGWQEWTQVVTACHAIADALMSRIESQ